MEISAKDIRARFDSSVSQYSAEPFGTDAESTTNSFVMVKNSEGSTRRGSLETNSVKPQYTSRIFTICFKIDEFDFALTDDMCNFKDIQEILRLTVCKASLDCLPNLQSDGEVQQYQVRLAVGDLQLDNQMYDVGLYHFPVVLAKHESASETNFLEVSLTCDKTADKIFTKRAEVSLSPVCMKLEDTLLYVLREFLTQFANIGTSEDQERSMDLPFPVLVNVESSRSLMHMERICINPVSLQVSLHASVKLFLSLEDTVLNLAKFEEEKLWCSGYSLGHTLSRHYLSGALFKAGWVVGSLDVIGNPAAFTRNVSEGIKDFVALPCEGIFNGPWGFMVGLTLGSSSLVKHVSAGTVTSITNFAKTVSRNLDKLSFDPEHWERNEEARRLKPKGVTEGVLYGLSGIGVSILGALGGLAHHPIQILINEGISPIKLVGGVGKGLVGMVAKPLGGAAEFIALTGQGLLVGTGWSKERRAIKMALPTLTLDLVSSNLKYQWKFPLAEKVVCSVDASLYSDRQYSPVTCILTQDSLIITNEDEDVIQHVHSLVTLNLEPSEEDPTLSVLKILTERSLDQSFQASDRVAQFVLDSIQYTGNRMEQMTENDLALLKPGPHIQEEYLLHINPRLREWFSICLDSLKNNLTDGN